MRLVRNNISSKNTKSIEEKIMVQESDKNGAENQSISNFKRVTRSMMI
jgi:hypothetical protein